MGKENEIRAIAYSIWEAEGRKHGHAFDQWLKAEAAWRAKQKPGYNDGEETATETITYPKDGQESAIGEIEIAASNPSNETSPAAKSSESTTSKPAPRHGKKKR